MFFVKQRHNVNIPKAGNQEIRTFNLKSQLNKITIFKYKKMTTFYYKIQTLIQILTLNKLFLH